VKSFYFITDAGLSRQGIIADVRDALAAGVRIVQYRAKDATTREMVEEARKLRAICRYAFFLVNDRVDVCLASAADGVHLGQDDMPLTLARELLGREKIIGITVHTVAEALEAQKRGADYLGVSPIFETSTKHDAGKAAGIRLMREIKQRTRLPLVAIGGITLSNAPSVIAAGADCLCAISAVVAAKNSKAEIVKFQELLNEER
jgi:thiamine-phosphate pyrophosphorylase